MADYREYCGLDFASEFLGHYGVGHDKGGHSGRYPWGSTNNVKPTASVAKESTKLLNSSEKSLAKGISKQLQSRRKFRRLIRKQNRKLDKLIKDNDAAPIKDKKVQKLEGKMDDVEYKMELQQDSIDYTRDLIDSTVKKLTASGYDIKMEEKQYDVAFGRYLLSQFLLGPAGTAVLSAVVKPDEQFINGFKWKVALPDDTTAIKSAITEGTHDSIRRIENKKAALDERSRELNSLARDMRYFWDAEELKKRYY